MREDIKILIVAIVTALIVYTVGVVLYSLYMRINMIGLILVGVLSSFAVTMFSLLSIYINSIKNEK